MTVLKDELHLHLYGCLTPLDVFELSKDHYTEREEALSWYASEYLRATGREPAWKHYFSGPNGIEKIAEDFLARTPMTFPEFQARFNLMIALLPTISHAPTVLNRVARRHVAEGIRYAEHRVFVPPMLNPQQLSEYYVMLANAAAHVNADYAGEYTVRLIPSVSRLPETFKVQYGVLRSLQNNQVVKDLITGIDFCGVEEGFPPENLEDVFELIARDNSDNPERAMAVLYHVGESFDSMSVFSAMRWVHRAAELGAHRLGHAIALAIKIENNGRFANGTRFREPREETAKLVSFLTRHPLCSGTPFCQRLGAQLQLELDKQVGDSLVMTWNQSLREAATALQTLILSQLKTTSTIIESCPTSNRVIGRIAPTSELPVFRFASTKSNYIISSDDPGIFATTLAEEESLCLEGGIPHDEFHRVARLTQNARAGLLAGRPIF